MSRTLVFGSRTWGEVPKRWGGNPVAPVSPQAIAKATAERKMIWDMLDGIQSGTAPVLSLFEELGADRSVITTIVEGEADGPDKCSGRWAKARGVEVDPYPVDNAIDGDWPAAGHRRNARMHRDGKPDRAIGFISGKVGSPMSKGSAGMLAICKRAGTPVMVYREDGVEA